MHLLATLMIIEAIIASITIITVSSLWVADRIHKRQVEEDADPKETALNNKKHTLEEALGDDVLRKAHNSCFSAQRDWAMVRTKELQAQLLAVEDERAKLYEADQ